MNIGAVSLRNSINSTSNRQNINFAKDPKKAEHKEHDSEKKSNKGLYIGGGVAAAAVVLFLMRNKIAATETFQNIKNRFSGKAKEVAAETVKPEITPEKKEGILNILGGLKANAEAKEVLSKFDALEAKVLKKFASKGKNTDEAFAILQKYGMKQDDENLIKFVFKRMGAMEQKQGKDYLKLNEMLGIQLEKKGATPQSIITGMVESAKSIAKSNKIMYMY